MDKIELPDGFVSIEDRFWYVGHGHDGSDKQKIYGVTINKIYTSDVRGTLTNITIYFDATGRGVTHFDGITPTTLKNICFKKFESAELELVGKLMTE